MLRNITQLKTKKKEMYTLFLGVSVIAGIFSFVLFMLPRSAPEKQVLWGLSAPRLLIGFVFLLFILLNIVAFFIVLKSQQEFERKFTSLFLKRQTFVMVTLYGFLILTGAILLLSIRPIRPLFLLLDPVSSRLGSLVGWGFFESLLLIVVLRIISSDTLHETPLLENLDQIVVLSALFLLTFFFYSQFAVLIGWVNKTKYSFFDLLAEQFVRGKLYLDNPPYTHDLTLYKGKWYVPMPPLPAILLMPLAYMVGAQKIHTSYISMFFSALNGIILFLTLKEMNHRKWLKLSQKARLALVILFLFGTPHLWLGISGRGWYFSQILTVFFLALAIYAALRSWSAWWIGVFVGLAIMTRPTAMMTTPFLLAITMQIRQEEGKKIEAKPILAWIFKAAVPITLAIASLLVYNYLRFENIFDFGYVTVNAGPDIVYNVQTWGTFSTHFIPINLSVMFFKLPFWDPTGRWLILPSATGMSIFLTTPALIYLFRRYPKDWWVIGAWTAVILSAGLMSLYHNTGAHQFGYRYILDFLLPLILLLGISLEKKVSWLFITLTVASILVNLYGAHWFMNG